LPRMRFHDLRHTKASIMIEQGENLKYIQTQLGHSNPTVTLNVYAHLMKPVNQEAACRYENMIFETNGSNMVAESKKRLQSETVTP
jgi:integrase